MDVASPANNDLLVGRRERADAGDHGSVAVPRGECPRWRRRGRVLPEGVGIVGRGRRGRAGDTGTRVEGGGNGEVVADVEDSAGKGDAAGTVLVFEEADVGTDLVDGNVITLACVWFRERVHGRQSEEGIDRCRSRLFIQNSMMLVFRHEWPD